MTHVHSRLLASMMTLGALCFAGSAAAKAEFASTIPNYSKSSCDTCHPKGTTASQNAFGLDVEPLVAMPKAQWWALVRDLDSDGDGQTNKQELGDPCDTWSLGKTPGRTTDIGNPGDAASLAVAPDVPDCGGGATTATTAATGGGATTVTAGSGEAATTGGSGATTGGTGVGGASSVAGGAKDSTGPGMAAPPPDAGYAGCSMPRGPTGTGPEGSLFAAAIAVSLASRRRARRAS